MAYLVDTSLLARLANTADARHATSVTAVVELHRRGEVLHVTPQVLVEFRSVATRPAMCHVHGVTHLLSFNVAHFARLANFGPGIAVVDPASV